ncbi:MAG TPA: N-acetylmuramic acid 6-phosphate etherase, partial [Devosia sp.]|nr:N-acetylmuramic acid 6-phosphate etherase [Devosia sp.]
MPSSHGSNKDGRKPESDGTTRETEQRQPCFAELETWEPSKILATLLEGQQQALNAVRNALADIEKSAIAAAERLSGDEGRIIYVGAGTSGRLGVLDGIELTPTFGWPSERLAFLFAGGDAGLTSAVEGAEDDEETARQLVAQAKLGASDVMVALAASGTTPFTRAAVKAAHAAGALTIAFANNPGAPLLGDAEIGILLRSGPEVLAGSTRLGAGTAQKIALGLFSTTLMIGLNKVHKGHMVDMVASNDKLKMRARRMLGDITGCDPDA